jgi:hypothetical protein
MTVLGQDLRVSRYEDSDFNKAARFLGLPVLPREGVALAARASGGCLSGKLVHRLRRQTK